MFFSKALVAAAAVVGAAAQRPANTSICDYYTTALLTNNTAANQRTLLTLVVNTAVIGNYTQPNVGIAVPGILANGTVNGTPVSLLPYFNGRLASSNRGGMSGVAINFLDGGGAAPLMMNMPANGTTNNQYFLLTHLYSYFGALLGCSRIGTNSSSTFPPYNGASSQYEVHKFMALSSAEVTYFITQVAMSAASFGVATADLQVVGTALNSIFNVNCGPAQIVIPSQGAALQSICIGTGCPLAVNATCSAQQNTTRPVVATSTYTNLPTATGTSGAGTPSGTTPATPAASTSRAAAAGTITFGSGVLAAGLAAFFL